jgi:hypothetical protein
VGHHTHTHTHGTHGAEHTTQDAQTPRPVDNRGGDDGGALQWTG